MLACCVLWVTAANAQDTSRLEVRVSPGTAPGCLESDSLRARVEHYTMARPNPEQRLRVEVTSDGETSGSFQVFRDDVSVARRYFSRLPADCADRRDAIALAIALALEAYLAQDAAAEAQHPRAKPNHGSASKPTSTPPASSESATGVAEPVRSDAAVREAEPSNPSAASESDAAPPPNASLEAPRPIDETPDADGALASAEGVPRRMVPVDRGESGGDTERAGSLPAEVYAGAGWLVEGLPWSVWTGLLGTRLSPGGRFAVDGTFLASPPSDHAVAGGDARGWLAGAMLSGCITHTLGAASLHGCAGILGSVCHVSGRGFDRPYPATNVPWIAAAVRLSADWPNRAPVMLRLLAQGQANVVRPELRVDGSTDVESSAPFGALLGGAVVVEVN